MAKSHTWFATSQDMPLILDWLREAKAEVLGMSTFPDDFASDGREFVLHFPLIGPVEYWPDDICLTDYPANSTRWRDALLVRDRSIAKRPVVDADRSAAAGLRLPEFRDNKFWVSGALWFPGARLREAFLELNRINYRFQRWVTSFTTVFDNTKVEQRLAHSSQLCMGGCIQRVVALPNALSLLQQGHHMVDHMASPRSLSE